MSDIEVIQTTPQEHSNVSTANGTSKPLNIETYHSNIDILSNYEMIKKTNKTKPIMTKYEKTKILGLRAEMIASGAKPLVNYPKHLTRAIDIVRIELEEHKIPFIIKRTTSTGVDYWKIEDLHIPE
jgi:DNA-directed RNA polymerase subunit K/omega